MNKLVFVLVVLLFGSNAIADANKWESGKRQSDEHESDGRENDERESDEYESDDHESKAYKKDKSKGRWSDRNGGRHKVKRYVKQDSVCNVVRGGTKGLFRLCVAYCEAKDVDSLFTKYQFDRRRAKLASLDKQTVLDRYNRRKLNTDPAMPCVEEVAPTLASCPCWSAQAVDVSNWQNRSVASKCLNAINSDEIEAGASGSDFTKLLALNVDIATNYCVFVDEQSNTEMMQLISEPDAMTCRAQVKTTCQALGLAG